MKKRTITRKEQEVSTKMTHCFVKYNHSATNFSSVRSIYQRSFKLISFILVEIILNKMRNKPTDRCRIIKRQLLPSGSLKIPNMIRCLEQCKLLDCPLLAYLLVKKIRLRKSFKMLYKLLNKHATPILSLHVIDSSIYHLRYPDK